MSLNGQFPEVYLNTTPELLRYLGLIRLVNGQMPRRLPQPRPIIRMLRNGPVLEQSVESPTPAKTPRTKRYDLKPVKVDMSDRNTIYTVDMLVWIKITDMLWWPGVVTEEAHHEKRRHSYVGVVASVKLNKKVTNVYNKDYIRPYDCPNKDEFITLGINTLTGAHSNLFKLDEFEEIVAVFNYHQATEKRDKQRIAENENLKRLLNNLDTVQNWLDDLESANPSATNNVDEDDMDTKTFKEGEKTEVNVNLNEEM